MIQYKEFIGSVHFDSSDEIFYGKIEGVNDLITFEGKSVSEIKKSFEKEVEDYIAICKNLRKQIHKSFRGNFNVRISPDLHKKAVTKSQILGVSLNKLVQKALEKEVAAMK
ncbi:type II toxin-antitoxin system HicB family antitoxin [candidate division KSB1 bacterium]|nr:type II toxin-antitoxin system HicB family antitoxin [candidate division KSB1 bacterium]MBL7092652.1 type II toxin-antitoxin system HicB family antitoxin [candidate division KSB1 bacterium]